MNLIVDIGNSTVKAAIFDGKTMVTRRRLAENVTDTIATLTAGYHIEACAWTSVGKPQPETEAFLNQLAERTLHVTGTTPTPLACDYRTPATLGADRLASAVGAFFLCPGRDLLVVDAGTCITCDYISSGGRYLGGNISPGLGMRLRAMNQQTARLPLVTVEEEPPAIGCDTPTALRAGAVRGLRYEIAGYVKDFRSRHPEGHVFVTGGNAPRLAQGQNAEFCDTLVETGINQILLYNR